ncbi:MAG: DUF58 domain-containing protein [Planctomycetales bacterium]|nr:DUF58 domain-containing protein [Planctomycetales bacterium]
MRTIAGLALLLLIGLMLGASMLVYSAYVLLAVFWICRSLSERWTTALTASRTISHLEAEVGGSVSVQLRLDNGSNLPVVWALVEDVLPAAALHGQPPALRMDGNNMRMTDVPARGSRVVSYRIEALRRGYFQIGPVIAETGDLLGLHRRFRRITEAAYLTVLPRLIPLDGYDVASRRPVGEIQVSYRLLEDPTLVSGIRKYEHGDPLRSIHWRASARTGQLQCKQYRPTSVAGATVVVDMHRGSNPDHHEPVRTDLAVTAAASICHTLLLLQQQFGLVSNGRDAVDRLTQPVKSPDGQEFDSFAQAKKQLSMKRESDRLRPVVLPLNKGPEHFSQIHRALARLERTDGLPIEELLIEIQSKMPRDATVLVIVQEVSESAALALGLLRRQGYSVAAIVNNYDNEAFTTAVGRLLAQYIAVYHLFDEQSIPQICKTLVLKY